MTAAQGGIDQTMNEIQQIKKEALELRKQARYSEALKLYNDLWSKYLDSCNEWEGWGYATCLRKLGNSEEALEICRAIYQKKPDFEAGNNLYAWCIYDIEIKKEKEQIQEDENSFIKAANAILNLTKQNKYSPYTKTVFKVIDYLINTKSIYPANEVLGWIDKLAPNDLSSEAFSIDDSEGKHREIQSEKEKWFAVKTKALEKSEQYQECIELCEKALNNLSKFHHSNDIWFKRRKALSKAGIGYKDQAIIELEDILQNRKEWFIQYEIAQLYFDMREIEKALKFSIDAALNFGKDENKWELFSLMAKILNNIGRIEDAKKHLLYSIKLRIDREWNIPESLNKMLLEFNINISEQINIKELNKDLKALWNKEKNSCSPPIQGTVKTMLQNGKAGFISGADGKDYYFKISSFKGDNNKLFRGLKVTFLTEESFDKKKNIKTKAAVHIQEK